MRKLIMGLALIAVAIFFGALAVTLAKAPASPGADGAQRPAQPAPPATTDKTGKPGGGDKTPTGDKADKGDKTATTSPAPAPIEPLIEPMHIDGADIADSLKLEMYKFGFQVPTGQYTVHLWIERWERGAAEPKNTVLIEQNGEFTKGTILIQVPTRTWPQGLVKLGSWEVRMDEPLEIGTPVSIRSLKTAEPIVDGGDIHLVSYAYSASGRAIAGLSGVEGQNDVTIYLKARLIPGPFKPFAKPAEEPAPTEPTPKADGPASP